MERARSIESLTSTVWVYADEIVSVSFAKDVGPMAWDSRPGSVGGNPFAPEREVNDD